MISSQALKNFVKDHERKLEAKILQAEEAESAHNADLEAAHWGNDCIDDRHDNRLQASAHWKAYKSAAMPARRRPKSSYFNFILTPTHR